MSNNVFPDNEIKFFGKITANVSHELNNVLSIINEYSGLLGDLLAMCKDSEQIDSDKIISITKNITEQTKRQKEIINLLNRFSHNVDSPLAEFVMNDLISDTVRLTKRFASLKRKELQLSVCLEDFRVVSNPLKIQHAVFLVLLLGLDFSSSSEPIEISIGKDADKAQVNIIFSDFNADEEIEQKTNLIKSILENIKSTVKTSKLNENQYIFALSLPLMIERV